MTTVTLALTNSPGRHLATSVEGVLDGVDGIQRARADTTNRWVTIAFDPERIGVLALVRLLERRGHYVAGVIPAAGRPSADAEVPTFAARQRRGPLPARPSVPARAPQTPSDLGHAHAAQITAGHVPQRCDDAHRADVTAAGGDDACGRPGGTRRHGRHRSQPPAAIHRAALAPPAPRRRVRRLETTCGNARRRPPAAVGQQTCEAAPTQRAGGQTPQAPATIIASRPHADR